MSAHSASPSSAPSQRKGLLGEPVRRKEDAALLTGKGRYTDDFPAPAGTLHAHIVRSPHPHAMILSIDSAEALALEGVEAVITGEDIRKLSDPFLVAVKEPIPQYALAVERVRFVGEPVALILAKDRYTAEDAAERVNIAYETLDAVIDTRAAIAQGAPLVHPDAG